MKTHNALITLTKRLLKLFLPFQKSSSSDSRNEFSSTVELTTEQQKARELDRLDDECKVLTRERDYLRGFLTDINRLLDDPDNSASRLEILEDIKMTYERGIEEKEALMGEKTRCMTWLRRPGGRYSPDKNVVPKAEVHFFLSLLI